MRATPVLAVAENLTVPGPGPPPAPVSHGALLVTVHGHSLSVATVTVPLPPSTGTVSRRGEMSIRQLAPAWVTLAVAPFTEMSACLAALPVFGAALNLISPLPWPAAGVRPAIQLAPAEAVHAHSASAETVREPDPPAAATDNWPPETATWHFAAGEGARDVVVEDSQPATARVNPTAATSSRQFFAKEIGISRVDMKPGQADVGMGASEPQRWPL